jgi:hypothetical protein
VNSFKACHKPYAEHHNTLNLTSIMKNLHFLIFSILFFLLPVCSQAQQNMFNKVYQDSPPSGIQALSIAPAFDNGYMIAGSAWPEPKGMVLKTDSFGNSVWAKSYGISNSTIVINSIIQTHDSCFVIAGSAFNVSTDKKEALCIKINASGDTVWSKTISGLSLTAVSVQQTRDSGYIISGYADDNNPPYNRVFAARLDGSGNLIWINVLTTNNWVQIAFSAKQTPDNGFLLIGYIAELAPYYTNTILIKLDESGVLSWSKKYKLNSSMFSAGYDFVNTPDGYLCYVNSGLMKIDFSGNVLWTKSYSDVLGSSINRAPPKLRQVSDGGYIMINGSFFLNGGKIIKTDSQGNQLWANHVMVDAVDVIETNQKELVIVGNGPLVGVKMPQTNELQIGIIQTDSSGNAADCVFSSSGVPLIDTITASSVTFTSITQGSSNIIYPDINTIDIDDRPGCVDCIGGITENAETMGISIFPNPATKIITIESEKEFKEAQLTIYNSKMQLVLQQSVKQKHLEIDISGFSSGVYFVKITSNNTTGVWKLVKQ